MSNSKKVERRLARLKEKYAKLGGTPSQLRRKAEVKNKKPLITVAPKITAETAEAMEMLDIVASLLQK